MRNRVELIGHMATDAEVKHLDSGKTVAKMDVSTWESYYNENKQAEDGSMGRWDSITDFHKVVVWGEAAKRCEKLKKNDAVLVEGKLKTRSWEDTDGKKRYATEVVGFVTKLPKDKIEKKEEQKSDDPITDIFGDEKDSIF